MRGGWHAWAARPRPGSPCAIAITLLQRAPSGECEKATGPPLLPGPGVGYFSPPPTPLHSTCPGVGVRA